MFESERAQVMSGRAHHEVGFEANPASVSPPPLLGGEGTVVGTQWLACGEGSPVLCFHNFLNPSVSHVIT